MGRIGTGGWGTEKSMMILREIWGSLLLPESSDLFQKAGRINPAF